MVGRSPRANFYNRKGYYKRRFKQLDADVMDLLNREVASLKVLPISAYHSMGYRAQRLGHMVEELMEQAAILSVTMAVKRDLAHGAMMLELFTTKLRQVAEQKWGDTLIAFPTYKSPFEGQGEVVPTEGITEMDRILGEADD